MFVYAKESCVNVNAFWMFLCFPFVCWISFRVGDLLTTIHLVVSSVSVYLSLLCTSESVLFVQSMMMGVGHE